MNRPFSRFASLALACVASWSGLAHAQSTIRHPGERTHYVLEAEPHLVAGLLDPPGYGAGNGLGVGFRGSVELVSVGFIPQLNNSVAIGFGVDYLRYDGWRGQRGSCEQFVSGPSGVPICVRASGSAGVDHANYLYLPVVMQWNFWLHRKWSVFGEPGVALYLQAGQLEFSPFVLYAGGRYQLSERITLTLRLGYPTVSLGASFLL